MHLLLAIAGMLVLSGPISYIFSNNVFAQTNSTDSLMYSQILMQKAFLTPKQ